MTSRSAVLDLVPVPASIPAARHVVMELLQAWGAPHDRDDAALLVTELVANVVDHVAGQALLALELTLSEDWLRVGVVDGSTVPPVVREVDLESPRGRGLRLVQAIADRWGCESHRDGKRVWFELRPPAL